MKIVGTLLNAFGEQVEYKIVEIGYNLHTTYKD